MNEISQQKRCLVFYVAKFFPEPRGAAHSALLLARALRAAGHKVDFIVDERTGDWVHGGEYDGFSVQSFTLETPGKLRKLRGLWLFSCHMWKRRRYYDALHVHGGSYVSIFLGWWNQILTGMPALLKVSSDGWDSLDAISRQRYGWLIKFCYRRIRGVVVMTEAQLSKIRANGFKGKARVIPNGVDCEVFKPADGDQKQVLREDVGLKKESFVFCYAGSPTRLKGMDTALTVYKGLRESGLDVQLLCVGGFPGMGDDEADIRKAVVSLGFSESIVNEDGFIWAGYKKHIHKYMQAADAFILPTRLEGFGTVQIEAMACGLPCVVGDLSGVTCDIIPDERMGFRISADDTKGYITVCRKLVEDREFGVSTGARARERAVDVFSIQKIARRYESFYDELCSID